MSNMKKDPTQNNDIFLAKPKKNPSSATKKGAVTPSNKKVKKVLKVNVKKPVKKEPKVQEKSFTLNKDASDHTDDILNFSGYNEAEKEKNDIVDYITYSESEEEVLNNYAPKPAEFSLQTEEEPKKEEEQPKVEEDKKNKKKKDKKSAQKNKNANEADKSNTQKKPNESKKNKKLKKKRRTLKQWFLSLKKAIRIYLICLLVLIIGLGGFGLVKGFDQSQIQTTFYQIKSDKVNNNIRVVVLSDLHLREFGEKNSELIAKVKKLNPDAIAIVGDMVNNNSNDYSVAIDLCKELVKICDVYYSYGNHESTILLFHDNAAQFKDDLFATGVKTLDNRSMELTVGETTIAVGGFSGGSDGMRTKTVEFMDKFSDNTDEFTLLLCHQPEVFISGKLDDYPVDLALCGHTHGGQVVLPYIGGLYSSNQGFLPEYDFGQFERENGTKIIISRGLGTSGMFPRFNNKPEICVVDINWY